MKSSHQQQILEILRTDPLTTRQALAVRLGIGRATVARHVMDLARKGAIVGHGHLLAADRYLVTVGAANMDITGMTQHPLAAGDSTPGNIRSAAGGVARNVAENLARLGHDVRLISAVGDDLYGSALLEHTRRAGVDIQACHVLAGQATSTYLSVHGPDGDMVLALNDMAIVEQLTPERLDLHARLLRHAGAVLVDCNLPDATLARVVSQAGDTPLFVEPVSAFKCRRLLPWLERIHTIKANRLEAQALTGEALEHDDAVIATARWLHGRGVRQVVLSLGVRGSYWSDHAGVSGWQPAVPVTVRNTTGAGDALMAGLMASFLDGDPLAEAIVFATGCAAMTLTTSQASHPDLSVATVRHLLDNASNPDAVGPPSQGLRTTGDGLAFSRPAGNP